MKCTPKVGQKLLGCFMKYSYEDRVRAVFYVLHDHMSAQSSALLLGCHKKDVQHWVARYKLYGAAGLRLRHGSYSGDFKLSVICYMRENHLSLFETAVKFGIPRDCTVNQWNRIYEREGASGLYRVNRGNMRKLKKPLLSIPVKMSEAELQAELEYLRAENAYLKKLRALVLERIARESGKESKPSKH
jgi:transposase